MHLNKHRVGSWFNLAILGSVILWSTTYPAVKLASGELDPTTIVALRFFWALVTALPLASINEKSKVPMRRHLGLIIIAGIAYGLTHLFWTYGINRIPASTSSLLMSISPIFSFLLAVMIGYERWNILRLLGVLLSLVGVIIILSVPDIRMMGETLFGSQVTILAAIMWAVSTVMSAGLIREYGPVRTTAYTVSIAALVILPLSVPSLLSQSWREVSTISWSAVVYSGVFGITIPVILWNKGVQTIGPTQTMVYSCLLPFFASVSSIILLNERIGVYEIVGAVVVVLGIVITRQYYSIRVPGYNTQ